MLSKYEIWPGPMEGIGRASFIDTVNSLRLVERWMTPFFRISTAVPKTAKLREFIAPFQNSGVPVCVQLMGTDAELLGETGARFVQLGADSINLNFGCPSARVCGGGTGGGALREPAKLPEFCCKVKSFLPSVEFSVKLRVGWESPAEMSNFLPQLAGCGAVDKLFIHYRTVKELYSAAALPEREARLAQAVRLCDGLPTVVNGDIDSVECAEKLLSAIPACGVMSARPWMRDPYLLLRMRGVPEVPSAEEGRRLFFAEAQLHRVPRGTLIELAKMLWGSDSHQFRELL